MEQAIINYKASEYIGRVGVAYHLGDTAKAKRLAQTLLVIYRLQARTANQKVLQAREAIRPLERGKKKLAETGVSFSLVESRLKKLRAELKAADAELADVGEAMSYMLDFWQNVGATLEDLCNLCNRDPAQVRERIGPENAGDSFSKLATVYNLDYKDPRDTGWLEDEVDAPLTHALKAFMLDKMLNTKEGREAAHKALQEVFPEIMENAMTLVTDADGNKFLIDKDGVATPVLDGEEDKK